MNQNILHKKELEFFGKITACISHELNNVLSIINEYTGLLEDLMLSCGDGKTFDKERIQKITKNISEQIQRKKELIKLLNRFAHRVDSLITTFNFNELLNDITRITQRFASLKKVNLKINISDIQTNLTTSPFILQYAVFETLNLGLEFCNSDDTILIHLGKEDFYQIVYIAIPTIEMYNETNQNIEFISDLMEIISGKIEISIEGTKQIFTLFIPSSISELQKEK